MKVSRGVVLTAILFAGLIDVSSQASAQPADSSTCWNVWRRGAQFSCPTCTRVEQMPLQITITKCDANPNAGDSMGGFSIAAVVFGPFSAAAAKAAEIGSVAATTFSGGGSTSTSAGAGGGGGGGQPPAVGSAGAISGATPSVAGETPSVVSGDLPGIVQGPQVGPTAISPQATGLSGGQPGDPADEPNLPPPTRRVGDSPKCQQAQAAYERARSEFPGKRSAILTEVNRLENEIKRLEDAKQPIKEQIDSLGLFSSYDELAALWLRISDIDSHIARLDLEIESVKFREGIEAVNIGGLMGLLCGFTSGGKWYPPNWKPGIPSSDQPPPPLPPALPPVTVVNTPPRNGPASPPTNVASAPPTKTPSTPAPSRSGNGPSCTKYTCTYVEQGGGVGAAKYTKWDVCVPSGDWSRASCTFEQWLYTKLANRPDNMPDPDHPDSRDVRDSCQLPSVFKVTDHDSFVKYCKSQFRGQVIEPEQQAQHANVASVSTADVAVASNKPASQPTTDVAVGSDKPASKPTTDVALGSPTLPKQPEPTPPHPASLPAPSAEPAPEPAPSASGGTAPAPQINVYIPPAAEPGPGPSVHPGPATPPSMPTGPDHGPQTAGPSNVPVNQPRPPQPNPPPNGGARINSCANVNGHWVCGEPSSNSGQAPKPGPQTNAGSKQQSPPGNTQGTQKIAPLPPTPVAPTGNASASGTKVAALPPTSVKPTGNAPAVGKQPAALPVAPVAPAPTPLPPQQAKAEPPPVQPACHGEGATFRPDQSESVTIHRTIVGGAPCIHQLTDRGVMFTGASIATAPRHGTLTQTDEYEFKYQPAAGFKGSDRYAVEVCGESDAGSGCSTLTYLVTVE